MLQKSIVSMLGGFLLLSSLCANSAIIDNGAYTTDTATGLDWLDLTTTSNRTFNDVNGNLGAGGEFEGWRYATYSDITTFLNTFGGVVLNGWHTANNGTFEALAPLWGDLKCIQASEACAIGDGESYFIYQHGVNVRYGHINDTSQINVHSGQDVSLTGDYINILGYLGSYESANILTAHALVRDASAIPVPAAAWLFGSALVVFGFIKRKK